MTEYNQSSQHVKQQQNADQIINQYGIQPEYLVALSQELGVTNTALRNFFTIIEQEKVPLDDLDNTLRTIAKNYHSMMRQVNSLDSIDPEIHDLQEKAKHHLERLEFTDAEALLQNAVALDFAAEKTMVDKLNQRRISAAKSLYTLGLCKQTQIHYQEAANYFQQALEKLPQDHEQYSVYLNQCGSIARVLSYYDKAIAYYEQALAADLKTYGEDHPAVALKRNNLGMVWQDLGDHEKAIDYIELALASDLNTYGEDHPADFQWHNNPARPKKIFIVFLVVYYTARKGEHLLRRKELLRVDEKLVDYGR